MMMLPAKLALATTMLVAAPAWFAVTATRDPEPAISDPAGHVFASKVQPGAAAKPGEAATAVVQAPTTSALTGAAQPGSAQASARGAEPPRRVVKVLVDSPFALPAGTVAIPAYDQAKPGPVPTPGSTLGSFPPAPPRRAALQKSRAEQIGAEEQASPAIKAKQRAAKARGLWKEAPTAFADDAPDADVTGALADEAPAAPEPRRRAAGMRHTHYAQAVRSPFAVFNAFLH